MSGSSASPTTDSREAVMRYSETEELEATGEWLLRVTEVGFSEELLYVPSQLNKLGVAPKDVVDRLDWLRGTDLHGSDGSGHDTVGETEEPAGEEEPEPQPEPELEPEPEVDPESTPEEQEVPVSTEERLEERPIPPIEEPLPLTLDYDSYGPWGWIEPIEKMVEDAILSILDPVPGLPDFNDLVALARPKQRSRGKRARAASATRIPRQSRAEELVGIGVGAIK